MAGTNKFSKALDSAVLHGDETGWRNDGQTNWLWSFGNQHLTYYLIDRSRGSPALAKFFIQEFAGTLVTDFWGAETRSRARRANVPGPSVARVGTDGAVQVAGRIGRPSPRSCGDWWGTRSGCGGGSRSCPSRHTLPAGTASTGGWPSSSTGRGRPPLPTLGKPPQAASVRLVHVPRSSRSSLRQQPRRTIDPPGGDPPQKQLRQPKPTRHRLPSRADERLPHAQTTRPRPDSNRRPGD